MFRRDFLKSFMAAASAACAGAAVATPEAIAKPLPPKLPHRKAADVPSLSSRSLLVMHLMRCRCIGIEESVTAGGLRSIRTTYIDAKDNLSAGVDLNKEAWHAIAGATPRSIQYICESPESRLDVSTLGGTYQTYSLPFHAPVRKIIVEWLA